MAVTTRWVRVDDMWWPILTLSILLVILSVILTGFILLH